MIQIFFSGLFGNIGKELRKVIIEPNSSVGQLKQKIASKITDLANKKTRLYKDRDVFITPATAEQINLGFNHKLLKDDQLLKDIGIEHKSSVWVVWRSHLSRSRSAICSEIRMNGRGERTTDQDSSPRASGTQKILKIPPDEIGRIIGAQGRNIFFINFKRCFIWGMYIKANIVKCTGTKCCTMFIMKLL